MRIVPTYAVAANVLSPYQGILDLTGISWLISELPAHPDQSLGLGCSIPARRPHPAVDRHGDERLLYRQFFLTLPDELVEAAKMDGAGALRFFFDMILPLLPAISRRSSPSCSFGAGTNISGHCSSPPTLRITSVYVVGLGTVIPGTRRHPRPDLTMASTLIVMLPPLIVVALTQRFFVRGLVATEK